MTTASRATERRSALRRRRLSLIAALVAALLLTGVTVAIAYGDGDPDGDTGNTGSSSSQEDPDGERPGPAASSSDPGADSGAAGDVADDEPLDFTDCGDSELGEHDGFQSADAVCVPTVFGEQSAQVNNPQLLITEFPDEVRPGEDITLRVSSRNIIRDRFLPAGAGGYYLEPSTLTEGIQRGHFHVACRPLASETEAPQPDRSPVFFAVEDARGGAFADEVIVTLEGGLDAEGPAQCAAWAGDGSHRIPMMAFANQVPAFDAVRLDVEGEPMPAEPDDATDGQHGGH